MFGVRLPLFAGVLTTFVAGITRLFSAGLAVMGLFLITLVSPIYAINLDRQTLISAIQGACPDAWQDILSDYIGGDITVTDPWNGNPDDRADFMLYLQSELANEALTSEEIKMAANDPMAVIAECSFQKLQLIRLQAHQAVNVKIPDSVLSEEFTHSLPVPDGSTEEYAAASCDVITLAYPSLPSGTYWIDVDGEGGNSPKRVNCNFDRLRDGSTQVLAASSCEAIGESVPGAVSGYFWLDPDGKSAINAKQVYCDIEVRRDGSTEALAALSCKFIKDNYPDVQTGWYWLDVNGGDSGDAFEARCDMSKEGGGWTRVVLQFDSDPVQSWNQGTTKRKNPTWPASYILSSSQIPAHSETAFGWHGDPTYVNYFDFVYSTGNIVKQTLIGKKDGVSYHIYRNTGNSYRYGNPDRSSVEIYAPTLDQFSLDRVGVTGLDWCFQPNHGTQSRRSYSLNGYKGKGTQTYGWAVWVR